MASVETVCGMCQDVPPHPPKKNNKKRGNLVVDDQWTSFSVLPILCFKQTSGYYFKYIYSLALQNIYNFKILVCIIVTV